LAEAKRNSTGSTGEHGVKRKDKQFVASSSWFDKLTTNAIDKLTTKLAERFPSPALGISRSLD
jgi:hypothetical protein